MKFLVEYDDGTRVFLNTLYNPNNKIIYIKNGKEYTLIYLGEKVEIPLLKFVDGQDPPKPWDLPKNEDV